MKAKQFGRYTLQECLGRGGMGEVWKALDTQLQRYVAVKFLRANLQTNPDFITHFMREAQFIASLHHPNIVQVHDFQIIPEQDSDVKAYMVMDYIEGGTLADYIRHTSRKGLFPPAADIVHLLTGMSLALDHAHHRGMIHRDIKPANILMDTSTDPSRVAGNPILTDFGIARLQDTNASTLTNALLGTPLYISPEQARNLPISERSDLYSLGIVLYELLTGVTPFRGDSAMVIMMQHVYDIPTPPALINPAISTALSAVVMQAISKDPTARFPSAIAMTVAVAQALNLSLPSILETSERTQALPENNSIIHRSQNSFSTMSFSQSVHLTPAPQPTPDISHSPHTQATFSTASPIEKDASYIATHRFDDVNTVITPMTLHNTPKYNNSASLPDIQQEPQATPTAPVASEQTTRVKQKGLFIALTIGILLLIVALSVFSLFPLLRSKNGASATPTALTSNVVGRIVFVSSQNASPNTFDQLQINLDTIPAPPAGKVYYAWLESSNETGAYPHWELQLSHGTLQKTYSSDTPNTDLFAQSTLFLITEESATNVPVIPTPDPARLYYAIITHQPAPSPGFEVMQCPSNDGTSSDSPCM